MKVKWVHPKWINGSHRTESFNWNVCMDLPSADNYTEKEKLQEFHSLYFEITWLIFHRNLKCKLSSLFFVFFFFFLLPAVNKHYLGVVLPCRIEASLFRASQHLSGREGTCWDRNWRRRACFEHKTSPTSEDRGHLHYLPTQRDPVQMRVNLMIVIMMIVVLYSNSCVIIVFNLTMRCVGHPCTLFLLSFLFFLYQTEHRKCMCVCLRSRGDECM